MSRALNFLYEILLLAACGVLVFGLLVWAGAIGLWAITPTEEIQDIAVSIFFRTCLLAIALGVFAAAARGAKAISDAAGEKRSG
jgi:hypothetical protein